MLDLVSAIVLCILAQPSAEQTPIVGLYRLFELAIVNNKPYANRFTDVDLTVTYTAPSGKKVDFWGFFDGDGRGGGDAASGNVWKLRFMPDELGRWTYAYNWTDGTPGAAGSFVCVKDGAGKGILRPYKDNPHWFAYNGTEPVWLKSYYETGHGSIAQDIDWIVENVYKRLIDRGYNHLQVNWLLSLCCFNQYYLDGPQPQTLDLTLYKDGTPSTSMRLDVWHMMERHLRFLNDHDVAVHMFLGFDGAKNQGPAWARLDRRQQEFYVKYVVSRLSPFANLGCWNFVWEVEGNRQDHELAWARLIRKYDVFGHMITYEDECPRDNFYHLPEYDLAAVENHLIAGPNKQIDRLHWKDPWTHHMAVIASFVGKPVFMSEGNALWRRYWHERTGATQDDLRRAAWACATGGASFCWNGHLKEYELYAWGPTGLPFGQDHPYADSARYVDILADVMTNKVQFYRMRPSDELLSRHDPMRVWALAEEGRQYLVFAGHGEPFAISLAKGNFVDNCWIDSRTGSQMPIRPISVKEDRQVRRFLPPSRSTDWVLVLVAEEIAGGRTGTTLQSDPEAAYTQTILERAERIVDMLGLDDLQKAMQVRDAIADQYRSLRDIHDTRDALIKSAKANGADSEIKAIEQMAKAMQERLHVRYIQQLSAILNQEQVDRVKDGMTYNLVQVTYQAYLRMLPNLTDRQRARIMASLVEAREQAMDAGSAEEKHAIFNRYKGIINNYLSAEGYNLKQASEALRSGSRSGSQ